MSEDSDVLARKMLPILIHYAQQRKTLTYGELGEKLNINAHFKVPAILGFIRDHYCIPMKLPWINSIVVNDKTGMPGHDVLPPEFDHLTGKEREAKYEELIDDAIRYPDWDRVLGELGLESIVSSSGELEEKIRQYNQAIIRSGGGEGDSAGGGEGLRHQKLKEYLSKSPQAIGITAMQRPKTEVMLLSGDRCDIVVELFGGHCAVIEVKVGDIPGELGKGIYQLIKYRAVLAAERGRGQPYEVELHLAAYQIPPEIHELAAKFGIMCHAVDVK